MAKKIFIEFDSVEVSGQDLGWRSFGRQTPGWTFYHLMLLIYSVI